MKTKEFTFKLRLTENGQLAKDIEKLVAMENEQKSKVLLKKM